MRSLSLSITCFSFVLMAVLGCDGNADPVARIRAKYIKQSADVLKIADPVRIAQTFAWKDGGSIGIELIDAKDTKHLFCMDGRFLPTKESPDEKGTRNLFIGAIHPTKPGAKMVEFRGPEESALYGVMLRIVNKHPEREVLLAKEIDEKLWEKRKLWATDMLDIHTLFHRLEGHFIQN